MFEDNENRKVQTEGSQNYLMVKKEIFDKKNWLETIPLMHHSFQIQVAHLLQFVNQLRKPSSHLFSSCSGQICIPLVWQACWPLH